MTDSHETVVVKDGGSSSSTILIAVLAVVIILAAGWYFLMGPGAGSKSGTDVNVDVNLPSLPAPAAS
jgi:hypothetical protein